MTEDLVGSLEGTGSVGPLLVCAMLRGHRRAELKHRFRQVSGTIWERMARNLEVSSNGNAAGKLLSAVAGVRVTGHDPDASRRLLLGEIARWDAFVDDWLSLDPEFTRRAAIPVRTAEEASAFLEGIRWFWREWIPTGFLSMIAGRPGVGKSYVAAWIAANWLKRWILPDGQPGEVVAEDSSTVLWIDTECSHELLVSRLRTMDAPRSSFFWPLDPRKPDDDFPQVDFAKPEWIGIVTDAALHRRPGLIVVDSLRGAHGLDENSSEVQGMLSALSAMARDVGSAVLLVHHLRKGRMGEGEEVTLDMVRGSTAIAGMCRVVMALDSPDPDTTAMRLRVLKSFCGFPDAIGVAIGDEGPKRADAPAKPRRTLSVDRAVDFLRELLERKPVAVGEVYSAAESETITKSALREARQRLRLVTAKIEGQWHWSLPSPRRETEAPRENGEWLR